LASARVPSPLFKSIVVSTWRMDGKGHVNLSDGATYQGQIVNGLQHGQGECISPDGTVFVGEWRNGHKYSGRDDYSDGSYYEGTMTATDETYRHDVWHGNGTYVQVTGDPAKNEPGGRKTYVGGWKDGLKDGLGTLTQSDGREYCGEWTRGMQNGHGVFVDPEGENYDGEWKMGIRHGKGIVKLPRFQTGVFMGTLVYSGEWVDGQWGGEGKIVYPDGTSYSGQVEAALYHGYGEAAYKDGSVYKGEWHRSNKQGHGSLIAPDGTKYCGEWKADLKHGKGKHYIAEGCEYEGRYEAGIKHGCGLMKLADGV